MIDRLGSKTTWWLSRAGIRSERLRAAAFAEVGARPHHYRLLAALEQDGPMSQTELAWMTGIDKADIVAELAMLDAYVSREQDAEDRRRNLVALTDAGQARLDELEQVVEQVQEQVLHALSERERATLMRLLRKTLK